MKLSLEDTQSESSQDRTAGSSSDETRVAGQYQSETPAMLTGAIAELNLKKVQLEQRLIEIRHAKRAHLSTDLTQLSEKDKEKLERLQKSIDNFGSDVMYSFKRAIIDSKEVSELVTLPKDEQDTLQINPSYLSDLAKQQGLGGEKLAQIAELETKILVKVRIEAELTFLTKALLGQDLLGYLTIPRDFFSSLKKERVNLFEEWRVEARKEWKNDSLVSMEEEEALITLLDETLKSITRKNARLTGMFSNSQLASSPRGVPSASMK